MARLKDSPLAKALKAPKAATHRRQSHTTVAVSHEVHQRGRDAAYWQRESLSALVERAILAEIERMEAERGDIFPPRPR